MATYTIAELVKAFRRVRGNTIQIGEEIPEKSYDFRAAPGTRSVAELLVHVAVGPTGQLHIHQDRLSSSAEVDLQWLFGLFAAAENEPRTKAAIIALLREEGERFAAFLEGLTDDFLDERVAHPGDPSPTKSRLEMLMGVKEHEMHHRGQLMLMQRMLGLVPHLTRRVDEALREASNESAG